MVYVYCVYSLESPRWGNSNENTQHTSMVKKIEKISIFCIMTLPYDEHSLARTTPISKIFPYFQRCPSHLSSTVLICKNNSKRAYQLVKNLTSEKQGRSTTIQENLGMSFWRTRDFQQMDRILLRNIHSLELWWQCSSGLQSAPRGRSSTVLCEDDEVAVAALKKGKSTGVDNIPAELVLAEGIPSLMF